MSIFQPKERVGLFIDGANAHETCKAIRLELDYGKLLNFYKKNFNLRRAFYFTAYRPNDVNSEFIRAKLDWLDYNGFKLITKPTKVWVNNGDTVVKGNMDIELACCAMSLAPHIDKAVLFTGDGDFTFLIDMLQQQDVVVSVVSTRSTHPPMIADELVRIADEFIELADFAKEHNFLRER
jgi:Uncharacterized conserved protein